MGMMRSSVGRYLRFSLVATTIVIALPIAGGVLAYAVYDGDSRALVALGVVGAVLALVLAVGAFVWKHRPESADVTFDELMLWRFFRRAHAEEQLNQSARALGLDFGGRPLRRTQMTSAERLKTLHSLAHALESKDPYTHGHSTRVEHLSVLTAKGLGLSEDEIADLRTAALLHDVGKIRIPTRTLRKPSELTIEEKLIVQEHSSVGAWMVSGVSDRRVVMSVRHHHERWDGNGYPDGIGGRDIPLFARIIAVSDSFDAMTSSRPYRGSMSRDAAVNEIRREAGTQFDPIVVDAFLESQPRRITVPGLFFPAAAAGMLRKVAAWGRRVGSTQVAETAAGAGIAAVVAASVFVPPVAAPSEGQESQLNRPSVEEGIAGADTSGDAIADKALRRNKNIVLGKNLHRRDGDKPVKEGGGATHDGGDGPPVLGGATTRPPGPDNPSKAPKDPPDPPGGEDPPAPPTPKKVHADPQPDKGRDCTNHPGQGGGGGNAKHCG